MKCIIPSAGPDLYSPGKGFRPLTEFQGRPLIEKALESRPWALQLAFEDVIFVCRESAGGNFLKAFLSNRWPGSESGTLPSITDRAMPSILNGIALCPDDTPIIFDLAYVLLECEKLSQICFADGCGAIIFTFESQDLSYSYVLEENGTVIQATEKIIIRDKASAGVYIFQNRGIYLNCAAYPIRILEYIQHKGI